MGSQVGRRAALLFFLLAFIAVVGMLGASRSPLRAQTARPNILVILTDDQPTLGTVGGMPNVRAWLENEGVH